MSDHYDGVLLEDIDDKLKAILEGQTSMAHVPQKLEDIDDRLSRVESDVKIIRRVVTEHSKELTVINNTLGIAQAHPTL